MNYQQLIRQYSGQKSSSQNPTSCYGFGSAPGLMTFQPPAAMESTAVPASSRFRALNATKVWKKKKAKKRSNKEVEGKKRRKRRTKRKTKRKKTLKKRKSAKKKKQAVRRKGKRSVSRTTVKRVLDSLS